MFEELLHNWGVRRMILLRRHEGNDSVRATDPKLDSRLVGHRKIPALQWAKLPRYWREGAVEVRPFTAETRLLVSMAQGLSVEAMKGNPTTTVIPGVDESKITPAELSEPKLTYSPNHHAPALGRCCVAW
jgi:hypothetical protein